MLGLAVAWLAAGCATTRPKPPASAVAESAITAAEMAAVFSGDEIGKAKLEIGVTPTDSAGHVLTPEEALRIAAAKNPSFAEYAAARAAALAEVMAATAWQNPSLQAGAGRGKTRESPSTSGFEYSLGLIQPVEWPGKRGVRKEAAAAGVKVAELDEVLFRSTLRADVLRAYWTAVGCGGDAGCAGQQLQRAAEALRLAEEQVTAGELNAAALLPFQRDVQKMGQEAKRLKTQRELAVNLLRRLCGGELPADQLVGLRVDGATAIRLEAVRELASKKHPAILKLVAETRRCELLVKQAELAKRPDFTPGLEASRGVDVTSWGARLGMELPFWNRNKAGIAAAQAEQHKAEAQLASKRLEVIAGVESAVLECQDAVSRAQSAQEFSGKAAQAAAVLQGMGASGETPRAPVIAAEQERLAAAREFWQAVQAVVLTRIQLEQAIGYGEMK